MLAEGPGGGNVPPAHKTGPNLLWPAIPNTGKNSNYFELGEFPIREKVVVDAPWVVRIG